MTNPSVEILTVEEAESRGWNAMVANHPVGTVFHHTAYARMVAATFRHMTPYYVSLLDKDGACSGGLSLFLVKSWLTGNRLVSIPWACYGDPLIRSGREFELLLQKTLELLGQVKASYLDIKARDSAGLLQGTNVAVTTHCCTTHRLDLTQGLDAVWRGMARTSIRQEIGKAERNGITVRLARSEGDVILFYRAWRKHRRELGLPSHRVAYFRNMWKFLVPLDLGQFWLADKGGKTLGGLCTFTFRDTMFLIYVAADRTFCRYGGGRYLYWAAIRSALERGMKTVDFGKTSARNKGLRDFKRRWGTDEVEVPVLYHPKVMGVSAFDEKSLSYRAMRQFWRVAPTGLSHIASRFFWRHTG